MLDCVIIPTALILDFMLGDPHWLPHPVRWMGRGISKYETYVRAKGYSLKISGIILAFGLPAGVWSLTFKTLYAIDIFNESLRWVIEVWLVYQCISVRGLYDETQKVFQALHSGEIEQARQHVSEIIGRDTDHLNESEISRAAVETIAEGTVDGVFSPLFYAAIGGAPLALAYKAISTLDSMVGYKNKQYADFGWASAKLDDLANWIPARLAVLMVPIAAAIAGLNVRESWRVGLRDRLKHPSPNAAHAEAAFAGAMDVRLGGSNFYQGVEKRKPVLNSEGVIATQAHIRQSWRLLFLSSLLIVNCIFGAQLSSSFIVYETIFDFSLWHDTYLISCLTK